MVTTTKPKGTSPKKVSYSKVASAAEPIRIAPLHQVKTSVAIQNRFRV